MSRSGLTFSLPQKAQAAAVSSALLAPEIVQDDDVFIAHRTFRAAKLLRVTTALVLRLVFRCKYFVNCLKNPWLT